MDRLTKLEKGAITQFLPALSAANLFMSLKENSVCAFVISCSLRDNGMFLWGFVVVVGPSSLLQLTIAIAAQQLKKTLNFFIIYYFDGVFYNSIQ